MKRKDIIILLTSLTILTILWVVFNIYHTSVTSTITDSLSIQIQPITPNFDIKTIEQLKQRARISPLYQAVSLQGPASSSGQLTTGEQINLDQQTASESSRIPTTGQQQLQP